MEYPATAALASKTAGLRDMALALPLAAGIAGGAAGFHGTGAMMPAVKAAPPGNPIASIGAANRANTQMAGGLGGAVLGAGGAAGALARRRLG